MGNNSKRKKLNIKIDNKDMTRVQKTSRTNAYNQKRASIYPEYFFSFNQQFQFYYSLEKKEISQNFHIF
jgi:hypothetical protein